MTIATDSTYGTDNNYGTMCEFFPNATSSGEDAGFGKLAGGFFNYPVREESESDRIYYGLYSLTCPWSGYSTAGNNVYMVGTGTSVTNPTNVSGGYYTTTGLSVFAQPVESGCTMGVMITVLTEAVKGLNEKIEALQAENQTFKAEIAALKAQ
ncbi:MAG: hypothetical protein JXN61_17525 [Sedimentisphaerales bacterium]|nr:hypothetical protein [Sedimentisphaerales bacterium]